MLYYCGCSDVTYKVNKAVSSTKRRRRSDTYLVSSCPSCLYFLCTFSFLCLPTGSWLLYLVLSWLDLPCLALPFYNYQHIIQYSTTTSYTNFWPFNKNFHPTSWHASHTLFFVSSLLVWSLHLTEQLDTYYFVQYNTDVLYHCLITVIHTVFSK